MSLFSRYASTAALAVGLAFTVAGAELSGAQAEETAQDAVGSAALTDERMPVFVSQEVVQPLPAAPEQDAADPAPAAQAGSLRELVSATPTDGALSAELECLAGAIYFEARGEPLMGQLAVAEVIINRSQSGRFPATYCGVVRQPGQFSFVRKGAIPQARRASQAWRNAVAVAQIAHGDQWQTHAGDALYFHARSVRPSWSHRKQALATIDSHIFYR
ncbi:MAG: cell wall hydrolase [Sphingomonadaceae bacterium]|nr:cell wall hydrolase [Sphingomonadaceae bacterium]